MIKLELALLISDLSTKGFGTLNCGVGGRGGREGGREEGVLRGGGGTGGKGRFGFGFGLW